MTDQDRTKEERGLAPRKEEQKQKNANTQSTTISNEDRTNEERGLAPRKEEQKQKNTYS
ncbi:MAG TPA: hypothetical protein VF242_08460 [Nitrososphaeraceae archaeon]